MKKTMVLMLGASLIGCGIASADLSVGWKNTSRIVWDVGGSTSAGPFVDNTKIQLIWSATGITTEPDNNYDVLNGTLLDGEFLLAESVSKAKGQWDEISGTYDDSYVGGADINDGYFFTRIFQDVEGSGGSFFYDVNQIASSNFVFSEKDPESKYTDTTLTSNIVIDGRGTKVIPEPGTIGLMGVAGLGLFLARKKSQR